MVPVCNWISIKYLRIFYIWTCVQNKMFKSIIETLHVKKIRTSKERILTDFWNRSERITLVMIAISHRNWFSFNPLWTFESYKYISHLSREKLWIKSLIRTCKLFLSNPSRPNFVRSICDTITFQNQDFFFSETCYSSLYFLFLFFCFFLFFSFSVVLLVCTCVLLNNRHHTKKVVDPATQRKDSEP